MHSVCEPAVYHNLAGVDGHPIKVWGSVTVPITVAGRNFEQKLIIVDHITAEGILGVDFLEKNNRVVDLAKRQITVEKYEAIPLVSTVPKCITANNVTMMEMFTIPAESEIQMMVQLSSGSGTWLIEGN